MHWICGHHDHCAPPSLPKSPEAPLTGGLMTSFSSRQNTLEIILSKDNIHKVCLSSNSCTIGRHQHTRLLFSTGGDALSLNRHQFHFRGGSCLVVVVPAAKVRSSRWQLWRSGGLESLFFNLVLELLVKPLSSRSLPTAAD